jgi:hypothetical protein
MPKSPSKQFVVCVKNEGYAASLEKRKLYVTLRDLAAEKHGLIRIVDESGDDYLYPAACYQKSNRSGSLVCARKGPPALFHILDMLRSRTEGFLRQRGLRELVDIAVEHRSSVRC